MSLVDYASSSEDENEAMPAKDLRLPEQDAVAAPQIKQAHHTPEELPNRQSEKLPDVALLLEAAEAPFSLGKRDPVPGVMPRGKIARRSSTHHPKVMPDTGLIPPQLSGRSNVVTEDIGRLFVRKQMETTSNSSPN